MNVASDIIFEKDIETQRRYLCVDLEQYGEELIPFLEKVGVLSHDDDFEQAWTSSLTGNELRQRMYQRIDAWPWKEK